jgi:hypothetical protein
MHIKRIEEDMRILHSRHVKLIREMEQNYEMIEKETQDYYIEFIQKYKEVASQRFHDQRQKYEQALKDKEHLEQEKERSESHLRDKLEQVQMERENLINEYEQDL